MPVTIAPLHPLFAGEVSGVAPPGRFARADVAAIEAGMDATPSWSSTTRHHRRRSSRLPRNFGALEDTAGGNVTKSPRTSASRPASPTSPISASDGKPLPRDDRQRMFNLGNRCGTPTARSAPCRPNTRCCPAASSPVWGANTEFADMRAAYDALDARTKAEIEDLVCEHSLIYSRGSLGFTDFTDEERRCSRRCASAWCAPIRSPAANRCSCPPMPAAIVGWPVPEARVFLRDLTEHATQPRVRLRPPLAADDLVMWDNRRPCTASAASTHEVRDMRRTTVAGDAPTVAQQAAE